MTDGKRPFRALVIQHEAATPGGLLFEWLEGRGIVTDVVLGTQPGGMPGGSAGEIVGLEEGDVDAA